MKSDSAICCNPFIYSELSTPNTLEFNNSFLTKSSGMNFPDYKRDSNSNCNKALLSILSKLYNVPMCNCLLFNSGVAIATCLSLNQRFNRVLIFKQTYVEMKSAFTIFKEKNHIMIDESFTDFKKDDLVCFESIAVPECKIYDYESLAKRAREAGAFICVDNTIKTWVRDKCKSLDPDFLIESLSKFSNGLNASLVGFLYCKDKSFVQRIRDTKRILGFYPHEFDLYLTICNIQTSILRMQQIERTSKRIKIMLDEIGGVDYKCYIPSGLFFFNLPSDIQSEEIYNLFKSFEVIQSADTFGAPFTVCAYWNGMNKIRISVGLEDFNDIVEDLNKIVRFTQKYRSD